MLTKIAKNIFPTSLIRPIEIYNGVRCGSGSCETIKHHPAFILIIYTYEFFYHSCWLRKLSHIFTKKGTHLRCPCLGIWADVNTARLAPSLPTIFVAQILLIAYNPLIISFIKLQLIITKCLFYPIPAPLPLSFRKGTLAQKLTAIFIIEIPTTPLSA